MAIRSFADKDTETVWLDRRVRRFQAFQAQAKRRPQCAERGRYAGRSSKQPGARLHRLRGGLAGKWSIAINAQYRIVFDWDDGPANVQITDYHR